MNKKEKITTNIKIPNKDWEILKIHFPQYFDKNGNFDFEKFKNYLTEKEINFSTESYGLEWLGKSYARLLASDPATTLLKADETHNSKPENAHAENLLIKGDNLEVLKHLTNAYYEKIKMIYIDPPYNTGNDGFVYNDDRKYTVEDLQNLLGIDEERAKRILDFTNSKSNSHSAWLTFMYPRLYIARQLLREDGVIFVSIDDNEVAQLRLLMDEIFGEENFVGDILRKTKSQTNDAKRGLNYQHEFALIYAKSLDIFSLQGDEKDFSNYKNPDNDPNGPWTISDPSARSGSISGIFEIKNPYTNTIDLPPKGRYWAFSKESFEKWVKTGKVVFKKEVKEGERGFILKKYLSEVKKDYRLVDSLFGTTNEYMNQVATKEVNHLLGDMSFTFPKPVSFIYKLIKYSTTSSDLILDFFAGSGTTGEAVMQLNAEDGGNRKFILVQLPEPIDQKKNQAAYDFVKNELKAEPTIFEITKERLLRAAKKINAELDEKIEKLKKELPTEETQAEIAKLERLKTQNTFKIFETTPIWEDYDFEAEEFDSSLTLFDAGKLTEDDIKALLTTWKTYDGIPLTQELESVVLSPESSEEKNTQNSKLNTQNYTAYYGSGKLYLMHKGFTTEHLKSLLEKIDTDPQFEPKTIIAFGYHFESARLRELAENLKNYNNKKKSDIDFIIRY